MPRLDVIPAGTPSFSEQIGQVLGQAGQGFGQGLSAGLQQHLQAKESKKQLSALSPYLRQTGMSEEDINSFVESGLPIELGVKLVEMQAKKKQEDLGKFETGLQTIQHMRDIVNTGNIGRGTSITRLFGGKDARAAAEYEQLGTSLIPLVAAGVPIRNQKEFDQYRKILTDASSSDEEIKGALDGLERIFKQKLEGTTERGVQGKEQMAQSNKLEIGSSFDKLPPAKDNKGLILDDGKKKYKSNGTSWRVIS
jgi:hypothetical protein